MKIKSYLVAVLWLFCANVYAEKAATDHSHHHAKSVDISSSDGAPQVKVVANRDTMKGWNLNFATTNFRFAPENVNKDHKAGEGHGHLYVDGVLVTRVYGNWYHLPDLSPGKHKITVTLNANNHSPLAVDGKKVVDEIEIEQ